MSLITECCSDSRCLSKVGQNRRQPNACEECWLAVLFTIVPKRPLPSAPARSARGMAWPHRHTVPCMAASPALTGDATPNSPGVGTLLELVLRHFLRSLAGVPSREQPLVNNQISNILSVFYRKTSALCLNKLSASVDGCDIRRRAILVVVVDASKRSRDDGPGQIARPESLGKMNSNWPSCS